MRTRPVGLGSVVFGASLLFLFAGCGERLPGSGEGPGPSPNEPEPTPPPPLQCDLPPVDPVAPPDCARVGAVASVRQTSHPSRAIEVDLRLEDGCGRALPRSYAACLEAPGSSLASREYEGASTLLLVEPAASIGGEAALRAAVDAFVAARPPTERIGVYRWDAALEQVADFTHERTRIAAQLAGGFATPGGASPLAAETALEEAVSIVTSVGGTSILDRRAVVVLAPSRAAPALALRAASVVWVDDAPPTLVEAARGAAARLDVIDRAGIVGLGTCESAEVVLRAPEGPLGETSIPLIAPLPEAVVGTCNAEAAATGVRSPLRRIRFSFTDAERATYQERDEANGTEDFTLSIQLGDEVAPVAAKAHFRGKGSLACSRQSYTVDLDGNQSRQLATGLASDEFLLISMCLDNAYSDQITAMQILSRFGLTPYGWKVVELEVDGESCGVYLLLGKPKERLRAIHARPTGLIRRGNESHDASPELKFAAPGVEPLAVYEAMLQDAETRSGADLLGALERRVDVDQTLRWVALMSLLGNGDYVDEVFFLLTEGHGSPSEAFFTIAAWDLDGLYQKCHFGGGDAMPDPRGLSYCVEGRLEVQLLSDPAGYDRYVEVLADVVDSITPADFHATLEQTAAELIPYFADPAVRAASEEIDRPLTQVEAEQRIRDELTRLELAFLARRAELVTGIDAYPRR